MFVGFVFTVLAAAGISPPTAAPDLAAIPRVLAREPTYQGTPKYCLLVFGKQAATRVWLVQDGNTLYIDRNGNGDLTEPGEQVSGSHATYFTVARLVERDGTVHSNLRIRNSSNGTFTLEMGHDGRREQYVGIGRMDRPSWGDRPGTAPIIHLNGPMSLERYGPVYTLPRGAGSLPARRFALRLMVGTPGLGKGTFASYDELCSENLGRLQADIEYPAARPSGAPIQQRVELIHDG